jgi:hypothetical protein
MAYCFLAKVLSGRWHSMATSAPADLRVVDVGSEPTERVAGLFTIYLASEAFDPIPDGGAYPEVMYTYKRGSA